MRAWIRPTLAGVVVLGAGCLDVSPVQGRPSGADVGSSETDAGAGRGCDRCLQPELGAERVCAAQLDACSSDRGCGELFQCLRRDGCLDVHGVEEQNRCAVPCALGLGVTSPGETRVLMVLAIMACAQRECQAVCY